MSDDTCNCCHAGTPCDCCAIHAPALNPAVHSPTHYKGAGGLDGIDVIDAFGLDFNLGNVVKYILRAGKKPGSAYATDLSKARWYLDRALSGKPGIAT